jgi:O-antigen biosynthesis protein WbqV
MSSKVNLKVRLIRVLGALYDFACAMIVVPLAYWVRISEVPEFSASILVLSGSLAVALLVFSYLYGLNQGSWRYASIEDLFGIIQSIVTSMIIALLITFVVSRLELVPRTVPLIAMAMLLMMMSGPRVLYRIYKDRFLQRVLIRSPRGEPVLVLGYTDEVDSFLRALGKQSDPEYRVVGIVDYNSRHIGRRLHSVKVLGGLPDLPQIITRMRENGTPIAKFVVAPSKASAETLAQIIETATDLGLPLYTLPSSTLLISSAERAQINPVSIRFEDLLSRKPAQIDLGPISRMLSDKSVLVTGGGGSIGSELVQQIARYAPRELVIIDNSEYNLYTIDQIIRQAHPDLQVRTILADVRDRGGMHTILASTHAEMVFHAAALKHVPIVEENVVEGAKTNVLGTINVADAAVNCGALAFVMISTDKAVNPTNVMGATKRFAEAYCQSLDLASFNTTKFMTVRFGNVLGSAGSVVPLFSRQIAQGGPVTVTHPDITRFFMTMREAVKLVLSASARGLDKPGERGRIMVLDMGKPVKIVDLAQRMIELAGLRPGVDIDIEFTGLRPGEKLYEERLEANEHIETTEDLWLHTALPREVDATRLARAVARLEDAASRRSETDVLTALREVVPELSSKHNALVDPDAQRQPNEPIAIFEARARLRKQ